MGLTTTIEADSVYREHFNLQERPFTQAPGQRFFTANAGVTDALGRLQHLVTARNAIAVVTGGPGVGKSTLAEVALASVPDPPLRIARVDLRYGEAEDIYGAIVAALGEESDTMRPAQAFIRLRSQMTRLVRDEHRLVLCLDIGGISTEVARHLLRVTNLAGEHACQMNIILMGPHPLHQQVDVPALIQLRQRIGFRYRVRPLTLAETERYVRHQVEAVGADATTLFSSNVATAAYCYVAGVPRLINTLLDAALSDGCMQKVQRPDGNLVKRTADGLGWKPMTPPLAGAEGAKPAGQAARPTPVRSSPPKVAIVASGNSPERARTAEPLTEAAAGSKPPLPPASDMTLQLRTNGANSDINPTRGPGISLAAEARSPTAAIFGAAGAERRKTAASGGGLPPPAVTMDEVDTSATGMLRLQDLDDRFAETIFGKEADDAAARRDTD